MLLVVYLLKCNGESLQTWGVKKKQKKNKKKNKQTNIYIYIQTYIYTYDIYHIKKNKQKKIKIILLDTFSTRLSLSHLNGSGDISRDFTTLYLIIQQFPIQSFYKTCLCFIFGGARQWARARTTLEDIRKGIIHHNQKLRNFFKA